MNAKTRVRPSHARTLPHARRLALAFALLAQVENRLRLPPAFFQAEYEAHLDALAAQEPLPGDECRVASRWEVANG